MKVDGRIGPMAFSQYRGILFTVEDRFSPLFGEQQMGDIKKIGSSMA